MTASAELCMTHACAAVQVVPGAALLRLAGQRPDLVLELGLRMSQGLKQQLGQLQAVQQVSHCALFPDRHAGVHA